MGCIDEPYLEGTPDMDVFFSRWLILGFTFGEAACAAQSSVSWQTTVVGDPLYRPFGKDPRALHEQLVARHSPWVEWSDLRWVDLNLAAGAAPERFIPFLQTNSTLLRSAILTEKLAALYQAAGKPDLAVKALRQALALHPTPQTTVRLTLALGNQLAASGQETDALKLYEDFQRHTPDYPDALPLWEKMRALAVKLDKKSQAARYEAEIKKLSPTLNP
jgi:tetratricopeptide (TPR) repeat protein